MKDLLEPIQHNDTFKRILSDLQSGKECSVGGLWASSSSYLLAALADKTDSRALIIVPHIEDAEEVTEDINLFLPNSASLFPAWEALSEDDVEPNADIFGQRLLIVRSLLSSDGIPLQKAKDRKKKCTLGRNSSGGLADFAQSNVACRETETEEGIAAKVSQKVIVTPVQALLQPVVSPKLIRDNTLIIRKGDTLDPERLREWLTDRDFEHTYQVELHGQFSMRGGIFDVYPFSSDVPYRIEFFGDEVDSLRVFDIDAQISDKEVSECRIVAMQKSLARNPGKDNHASLIDYLPESQAWIAFKESMEIQRRAEKAFYGLDSQGAFDFEELWQQCSRFPKILTSAMPFGSSGDVGINNSVNSHIDNSRRIVYDFNVESLERFAHAPAAASVEEQSLKALRMLAKISEDNIRFGTSNGCPQRAVIFCSNSAEQQRLKELLTNLGQSQSDSYDATQSDSPKLEWQSESVARIGNLHHIEFRIGRLNHGFDFTDINILLIPHHEIFHRYRQRRQPKKTVPTRAIDSFLDLSRGDYVVHAAHGIGRFLGMTLIDRDGRKEEFLMIEFADRVKLYVPVRNIELVQKYVGIGDQKPRLSKFGGSTWERRKARAKQAVEDLAAELLELQAIRASERGIRYPADDEWQRKFEAEFIYEETEDQLQVAEEIKSDMQLSKPMDRLVCGDVGYGKTELAMRGAFKAVMFGKQVAVLVPTTVLAQQHYRTFTERMADYPIVVDMLSRFRTKSEQSDTLERLKEGKIDIIIGTHRLIQKDVAFKDLGLVIIDEEQRFGVEHKERLKRLRETVDVLTLTATPIPRTLHMSLLGIKDISSLNTPPQDRLAIQTRLWRFDRNKIRQAILRELNRDGQVFFVHNRVYNINHVADTLSEIVPEARIIVAHGQMPERLLEQRMLDFIERKADILVSTTIIESGLDIPNVNTIFINRADHFGLADLHQLRGRVGRYKHRAYAYLLLPDNKPITPDAEKRLKAIEEFSELGAGFKIAMRDLEIRGAGNILGREQSGHITAVGYEMYCRLLEAAIRHAKHEEVPEPINVSLSIGVESYLPDDYIPDPKQKMEIYRKLNKAQSCDEVDEIGNELRDRFGAIQHVVHNLLEQTRLRVLAQGTAISSIVLEDSGIAMKTEDISKVKTKLLKAKMQPRLLSDETLYVPLNGNQTRPEQVLDMLNRTLK